jgi:hypothetical protein
MTMTTTLTSGGYVVSIDPTSTSNTQSDSLPAQARAVSATGQVVAGPCRVVSVRCLTAGTVTFRDAVTQTAAGTDTTSPILYTATLAAGDYVRVQLDAAFGLHATVASGTYEVEF